MTTTTTYHPVTPAEHAMTAYNAVHALTDATQQPAGIDPPEVASTLVHLACLNSQLSQVSTHLADALTQSLTADDLYDNTGTDPAHTVSTAQHHLRAAATTARDLGRHLYLAHTVTDHLRHHSGATDATDPGTDPVLW